MLNKQNTAPITMYNKISSEIDFKVSESINKVAEDFNTSLNWNKSSASIIEESLTKHALTSSFTPMSPCYDDFAQNNLAYIRKPLIKGDNFKNLRRHNNQSIDKVRPGL